MKETMQKLMAPFLTFVAFLLFGFVSLVWDTSEQSSIDRSPLNEIKVTSKRKFYGPCSYLRQQRMQVYLDCIIAAMNRDDV